MNALAAIRHKHHSVTVLSVALFAWLGVLATSCAMIIVSEAPTSEMSSGIGIHDDRSNSKPTMSMADWKYCRDRSAALSGESPELLELITLTALPIDPDLFNPILSNEVSGDRQKPPLREASPPVYLATQRLRI